MSDEDLKKLATDLELIGSASGNISKIVNLVRLIVGGVVACVVLCGTSILWVNAKANAITMLETQATKSELAREVNIKEWSAWRSDIEKILATLSANQARVIQLQNQQADLIARHLDKP